MDQNSQPEPELPVPPEPIVESPPPEPTATPTPPEPAPAKPTAEPAAQPATTKSSRLQRLRSWSKNHKKLSIPLAVFIVLVLLAAVPTTRYQGAGLFLSRNMTIKVVDSATGKPVSGATVSFAGQTAQTNGDGQASLKLKDGYRQVQVALQYYQTGSAKILVPILSPKAIPTISMVATGRQTDVTIDDLISGDALAGVIIKVAGITATTDKSGGAALVLPVGQATQKATLSLAGYNDSTVNLQVSDTDVKVNTFNLVPSGKLYFLSDASGKIDVMAANLDGSSAKVLLAGTGNEENGSTSIFVSPDSKYIALETNRSGATPLIYLVNTSTGAASLVDSSNASYTMYGWMSDKLIYSASSSAVHTWQAGRNKLKSYDTASGAKLTLDQSLATGSSASAADEGYSQVFLLHSSSQIAYYKSWQVDFSLASTPSLISKQNSFNVVNLDDSNLQNIAKYPASHSVFFGQYSPTAYYISDGSSSTPTKYYSWKAGTLSPLAVSISSSQFDKTTPYYYSPNLQKTVWSEARNDANASFIGDSSGANAKQIGGSQDLSAQAAFGWINNNYALLDIVGGCNLQVVSTNAADTHQVAVKDCLRSYSSYNGN